MDQWLIALDVDGTLFDGTRVADAAVLALHRAKADGHLLVVVTGRPWDDLSSVIGVVLALFDRAVCEEGGVLVDVSTGEMTLLGSPVEPEIIAALHASGARPLIVGHVMVSASADHRAAFDEVRRSLGANLALVVNKGSVALTTKHCDKASGLRAAVEDLAADGVPIIAIGDAQNDLAMFAVATVPIGLANADDAVRRSGVTLTRGAFGDGVAEALLRHLPAMPEN